MSFKPESGKDVFIEYENGWKFHLQFGDFQYKGGKSEEGYRHIWEDPQGNFVPKNASTRIPSLEDSLELILKALRAGW